MTTWSGMVNGQQGLTYSLLVNTDNNIARVCNAADRMGFNKYEGLFNALIGAGTGGTASMTRRRVAAQTGDVGNLAPSVGGKRVIETVTDINRKTTAADVTALKSYVVGVRFAPASYPTNKAGSMARWW